MRVGITGHRGLPAETAALVQAVLQETVNHYPSVPLVGLSCLADGPDAWFAQAILEHGGTLEAVIPAQTYRDDLPKWHHPMYDDLLRRATDVHETGLTTSDSQAHMSGSELLVGLLDELLAVWDGQPARGYGGTADVVKYAERTGVPVRVLWPHGASRG
ncbi:MAG: hypothetical protein JO362_06985 [Streptomycetaceae bacterium]|nr:hypothetical protein [Streptomycetaceae bacterium]